MAVHSRALLNEMCSKGKGANKDVSKKDTVKKSVKKPKSK